MKRIKTPTDGAESPVMVTVMLVEVKIGVMEWC